MWCFELDMLQKQFETIRYPMDRTCNGVPTNRRLAWRNIIETLGTSVYLTDDNWIKTDVLAFINLKRVVVRMLYAIHVLSVFVTGDGNYIITRENHLRAQSLTWRPTRILGHRYRVKSNLSSSASRRFSRVVCTSVHRALCRVILTKRVRLYKVEDGLRQVLIMQTILIWFRSRCKRLLKSFSH